MYSPRNFLSITLLLGLLSAVVTAQIPQQRTQSQEERSDIDAFQKLLDQVDPPSLHAALHNYSPKKFKHGMFQEDRTAVEAIRKEEPSLATSIINVAKRQDTNISNGTSANTSPSIASASSPPASSPALEPATTRVMPSPQGPASDTTTASPPPPASNSPTTSAPVVVPATTASTPARVNTPSTTPATTVAPPTSSAPANSPSSSLTPGEVITTTNSFGLTIVSTIGGGVRTLTPSSSQSVVTSTRPASSQTSTFVRTSTLPDGSQSTITAVTVVGAAAADTPTGAAGVTASGTGSGTPGLQTGEAVSTRGCVWEMTLVMGAAVGVAMMM